MQKKAILLIAHGSRSPRHKETIESLTKTIEHFSNWDEVAYSFLEVERPSINEALERLCLDPDIKIIVLAPVLISFGKHVEEDICQMFGMSSTVRTADREHNGVMRKIVLSDPIGNDKRLASIINDGALRSLIKNDLAQ